VRSQLDLERQLCYWLAGGADPRAAGTVGDWTLSLEGDLVVLNPHLQRWVFYDAVHGGWVDSGMVVGEAIFVPTSAGAGARRALRPGEERWALERRVEAIGARLLAACDGQLFGALEHAELWALWAARPGAELRVWTPYRTSWLDGPGYFGSSPAAPQT